MSVLVALASRDCLKKKERKLFWSQVTVQRRLLACRGHPRVLDTQTLVSRVNGISFPYSPGSAKFGGL